jgi:DNA-binding NarL/FixJ family response regulator
MEKSIKIIIADDIERWRKVIIEEVQRHNITVIAEAKNGEELLIQLETLRPDVILLDLSMPILDGNQALSLIIKKFPAAKVIIMSLFNDPTLMQDYIMRDVKGCFSKTDAAADISELANVIKKVHNGGTYFYHNESDKIMNFSIRQKEIINQLGQGKTTTTIAKELNLTRNAVNKQKSKIMEIMGVKTPTEMLKHIFEKGLQYFRSPPPPNKNK